MKTIKHNGGTLDVCIYEFNGEKLRGSFFKDKPEVGDKIDSHAHCPQGMIISVDSIISIKDAKVTKSCSRNGDMAHYELGVSLVKL